LRISAASTVMARLVGIIDAVAVLRPVDDAHVMVSHSRRVLAVFIIARAAAVLHRCSYRAATALGFCLLAAALRRVDVRSDGGRMRLRRLRDGVRRPVWHQMVPRAAKSG
jgi:hypothetical protein